MSRSVEPAHPHPIRHFSLTGFVDIWNRETSILPSFFVQIGQSEDTLYRIDQVATV